MEWRYQLYKDPQVRERYRYLEENEKTEMDWIKIQQEEPV